MTICREAFRKRTVGIRVFGFALFGAALVNAAPVMAAYSVHLNSTASSGGIYSSGSASCRYNNSSTGGACSTNTGNYGGTADATVTPNGGDNSATSASASESTSGAGATASAAASVDLPTASLHLSGADSGVISSASSPIPTGGTNSYASFSDVLHFVVAGASAETVTPFTLLFNLDGQMYRTGSNVDNGSFGEIYGSLFFGASDARFDLKNDSSTGFMTTVNYLDTYPSAATGTWTTNADHTLNSYAETFNIFGASKDFAVALEASLPCGRGMTCDYGNTAKIGLQLPTGTSFTSDSGAFLTAPTTVTSAVPEPATWGMMLLGFGVMGGTMRRQRKTKGLMQIA